MLTEGDALSRNRGLSESDMKVRMHLCLFTSRPSFMHKSAAVVCSPQEATGWDRTWVQHTSSHLKRQFLIPFGISSSDLFTTCYVICHVIAFAHLCVIFRVDAHAIWCHMISYDHAHIHPFAIHSSRLGVCHPTFKVMPMTSASCRLARLGRVHSP